MRRHRFTALTFSGRFEPAPISPTPEPVPAPEDDADDGREVALRGLFDLEPAEVVPVPASASPSIVVAPRRYARARGYVIGRIVCGASATILCRAALDWKLLPLLTFSIADDKGAEPGPSASMGLGSLASLVLKLGGLFLEMGGERDTLDRIEATDGPSIWDRWRAEKLGTAPARKRDRDWPAQAIVAPARPVPAVAARAPEDRRERVPGQPPRSYVAATRGSRR